MKMTGYYSTKTMHAGCKLFFALLEMFAFLLPGLIAVWGYPWVCLLVLFVYWAGHIAGGNAWYKHARKQTCS